MKFNKYFFNEEKNFWVRCFLYYFSILGFIMYLGIFCQLTGFWKDYTDVLTPILEFEFQNKFIQFFYSLFSSLSMGISIFVFPVFLWSLIKKR